VLQIKNQLFIIFLILYYCYWAPSVNGHLLSLLILSILQVDKSGPPQDPSNHRRTVYKAADYIENR